MATFASLKQLLGPRFVESAQRLQRYEIPERGAPGRTPGVLLAQSEAEVGEILRVCNAQRQPLVISAGRTGLVEAQRPQGEVVLSLEKLNRILDIDPVARIATCEAGVAIDTLNQALAPHGLVWPLAIGSSSAATVGACVANASAGANAVCYGTAAHLCESAWGWWGNGEAAGPCSGPQWMLPDPAILAIDSARIRPEWGLIGTQGGLGVITRLCLRLHALPAQREAALLPVPGMPAAMDLFAAARARFGSGVEEFEFISAAAMTLVQAYLGEGFRMPLATLDAPYYVLLQLRSDDADIDLAAALYEFLSVERTLPDRQIGYAPLKALKILRHSITEASNARMRALGGGRLSFDTAAPVARFGDYLHTLARELARRSPGLAFIAFGHAGVGGAHLHLLGTAAAPVAAYAEELTACVFDVTADFGGTFSAEHGVGSKWGAEFLRRTAPELIAELKSAKLARDPINILNPRCFAFDQLLAA